MPVYSGFSKVLLSKWNVDLTLCLCSISQSCLTLCDPTDCSTPGFPVLHHLLELVQTDVHWVSDAVNHLVLCYLLLLLPSVFPSIPRVNSSHQVAKVLELQPQFFQWIFWIDLFLGLTGWSPFCPRDFQESSPTPQLRHQFFNAQPSLWSNSHIHTWLLEKP